MALLVTSTILNLPFPNAVGRTSGQPFNISGSDYADCNDTYAYQSDYNGKSCYYNMGKIASDGTIILSAGTSMVYWEGSRWVVYSSR